MGKVHIYTDGGAKDFDGNGKFHGGWGVFFSVGKVEWGHWSPGPTDCTNNRAELLAYANALENVLGQGWTTPTIHIDSKYVLKGAQRYLPNWKRNGFMTGDAPVKNQDEWIKIDQLQETLSAKGIVPTLKWVKGHSENRGNDEADALATKGRDAAYAGVEPCVYRVEGLLTEMADSSESVEAVPAVVESVIVSENQTDEDVPKKPKKVKIDPANAFLALDRILDMTHRPQAKSVCGRTIYMLTEFAKQSKSDDDEEASRRKKAEAKTRNCGHLIPDSCIGVALLKEECGIYKAIREQQNLAAPKSADFPFLVDWRNVITKSQWEKFNTLPMEEVVKVHEPNLFLYKDKKPGDKRTPTDQFSYFLGVPRLARDAVEYCGTLLGALDDYRNDGLSEKPIDLSSFFVDVNDKGKRTAKKTTELGKSIRLEVAHEGKTIPVILTAGSDYPKVPALLRMIKQDPTTTIKLIKRVCTPVSFRTAIVVENEDDIAIFSGPATSIQLVP